MTKNEKISLLKNRIMVLEGRGDKNIKSGGCLRALKRELRYLEKSNS